MLNSVSPHLLGPLIKLYVFESVGGPWETAGNTACQPMTRGQRFLRGSPCLLFFSFFLFLAAHGPTSTAGPVQCNDAAGNYTSNSTFQANLGRLLASLSANTSATGYFNDTEGRGPDQVFGHATCRGDLSAATCRDCVTKAAGDTLTNCPNRRAVIAWYDDTCLLRYAGESFFGSPTGMKYLVFRTDKVSDQQFAAYNQVLDGLMDRVATDAVSSPRKFAVGEANFNFRKLYGMAQCTRDLVADPCDSCLRGEIGKIPNYSCNGTLGCTVLGGSCVIRFNIDDRFYNETAAAEPSPPPPPPPLQAPPSENPPVPNTPSPSASEATLGQRRYLSRLG